MENGACIFRTLHGCVFILIYSLVDGAGTENAVNYINCQTVSPLTHSINLKIISPPRSSHDGVTHTSSSTGFKISDFVQKDWKKDSSKVAPAEENYTVPNFEGVSSPVSSYSYLTGKTESPVRNGFSGSVNDGESVVHAISSPVLNCSSPDRLVGIQVRRHLSRRVYTAGVFICPTVKVLQLQVIGGKGHLVHVPVKVTVTSCDHSNDTAVIVKGRHRLHVTLRFTVLQPTSSIERLNYSYSLHERSSIVHRQQNEPAKAIAEGVHYAEQAALRWKRSVKDHTPSMVPSSANDTDSDAIGTTSGCGESKTCIRYGYEGCGHLTCDYMLSYYVINSTDVDMELSARGTGWVAVGFSSDKFMGGGDDVMGCKQSRKLSPLVESMSLGNAVKHSSPREKENRITLLAGRLQNDHIYCRVRRPLKFKERLADSDLDLFNDWHQLYAYGDIDGSGRIVQHTDEPRVSERKITMVRVTDIMVVTSTASLPLTISSLFSILLPLTLTFAGS